MKKAKISIIIPVYHEEKNILKILKKIHEHVKTDHEIIIVFDSFADPTIPVIEPYLHVYPLRLMQNAVGKKGVLNAIKMGFRSARGEAIVVVMADLSDDTSQIDVMYQHIQNGADIVCASRYMKGGKKIGGGMLKSWLSKLAGLSLHYIFRIPTHDATNAFKMYRKSIFKDIHIESKEGFVYSLEMIIKAYKKGLNIAEIPTTWRDREAGNSQFKLQSWLPSYIKTYATIFPKIPQYVLLLLFYLFTLMLELLQIGYTVRHGILIGSTLDFSWKSDLVERLLHGYIAGKDFVFTYGPFYQLLIGLPSFVFHIPSYASVMAAQLLFITLVFWGTYILICLITEHKGDRISLLVYFLFLIGIACADNAEQITRILPILIFSLLFYSFVYRQKTVHWRIIFVALLPSPLGLYSYDLFIQCVLIAFIFLPVAVYHFWKHKHSMLPLGIFFLSVLLSQLLTTILLSGNFMYLQGSLDTLSSYLYIMNIPWAFGTSNVLFIFPLLLPLLFVFMFFSEKITSQQKTLFFILVMTAILQLRTTFIRSDEGHIIAGIYPSIIVVFLLLYYLLKEKFTTSLIIFSFLFILIPYKITYDRIFSPKNIIAAVNLFTNPPSFSALFDLPKQYSFTEKELRALTSLIQDNPESVFVYPYDSYILNTQNQTYNSYALQLYAYSGSLTEQETVKRLKKNLPRHIILGIDGKTALALDDIPNLTRNPLIARFFLDNYMVATQTPRYLILTYNPLRQKIAASDSCTLQKITFTSPKENIFIEIFSTFVKPSLYYLQTDTHLIRLPHKPTTKGSLIFDSYESSELAKIFGQKINWDTPKQNREKSKKMQILKQFPFAKNQTVIPSTQSNLALHCLN